MGKPSPPITQNAAQGTATLIVMVAVLVIIVLFCCFAAPGIRGLCKRYIFRTCDIDDPDLDNASRLTEEASPTVILLPNGRLLVVDRRLVLRSSTSNLRGPPGSTPSNLDSSETSKGVSPISLGYPPPDYDAVFPRPFDLPPSYSEISLMAKNLEAMEMVSVDRNFGALDVADSNFGAVEVEVRSCGLGASVEVAASDGSFEAIDMTAMEGSCKAVKVAPCNGTFEAIKCERDVNSDRNTVIVVENIWEVVDGRNNDYEDNVERTSNNF